jgi:hypothetical protein
MHIGRIVLGATMTIFLSGGGLAAAVPAAQGATTPMPVAQNGNFATAFTRAYPALGRTWFDRAAAYVWPKFSQPVAKPYRATTGCDRFTSYATFAAQVKSGAVTTRKSRCVMFDLEGGVRLHPWPSPAREQADPEKYMPEFNRLARAHGFTVIESPGADLQNTDTTCPHPKPDSAYYQACRLAYYAAQGGANIVLVQDQQATLTPAVYGTWFKTARSQALAVPGTRVFTTCGQSRGTAAQCVTDVRAAGRSGGLDVMQDTTASWEAAVLRALG